jgi:hypothetical protein
MRVRAGELTPEALCRRGAGHKRAHNVLESVRHYGGPAELDPT